MFIHLFIFGCARSLLVRAGYSLGLLIAVVFLVAEYGFRCMESVVVVHRLSCSVACGLLPDQGSNLCLLHHWQADSLPLHHQGSTPPPHQSPPSKISFAMVPSTETDPIAAGSVLNPVWLLTACALCLGTRGITGKALKEPSLLLFRNSVLSCVQLFVTPWTVVHRALLSMEFSRQEYWSGLLFPSPGNLPDPGIKPTSLGSLALAGRFFTTVPPGKSQKNDD